MMPMAPTMGHIGHPISHPSHGGPPINAPSGPNTLSTSTNQSNKSTVVVKKNLRILKDYL